MPITTLRTVLVALIAAAVLAPTWAAASPRGQAHRRGRIDARRDQQAERVEQGKRSGEITKREARKIEQDQRAVRRAEDRAKADGVVTRREARKIERKQDKASRDIQRAKHNGRKAPRAR